MSRRPERLILIHGAWAAAWVWEALVDALQELGREAVALDLPGDGHHPIAAGDVRPEDYLDCLAQATGDGPVALIGHSGGGMLVTAAADRLAARVTHGIWIAGMLLPGGESFDDIQERVAGPGQRIGVTPHIRPSHDGLTSTVPPEAAVRHFFQDLDPETAARAAARLTPQPAAGHRITTHAGPGFDALPKLYVLATQDNSVVPEAQRLMCEGVAGLDIVEMDSGHAPQVSRPDELARVIDTWLMRTPA
jgi:pimeloyl-ACP methyl ester carboxylesterase